MSLCFPKALFLSMMSKELRVFGVMPVLFI